MDDQHDADCGCQEYNELSRRQFITGVSAAGAAAMFPAWLPKIVLAETYASNRDVIVSIFQRGGADGLSIVVPFGDPDYYTGRPTIAIPRPDATGTNKVTALDNFFGFPPAMLGLLPAFLAKDLLAVHAAGRLTETSRSHFDAQRYIEVGKPADPAIISGWLGRHLASSPPVRSTAPLRALGLSSGLQKTLVPPLPSQFDTRTLPIPTPGNYTLAGASTTSPQRVSLLSSDYASAPDPVGPAALTATNTFAVLQQANVNAYKPANGAVYPTSSFGTALKSVAALIVADIGIEAAQIDISAWDTHASQDPNAGSMFRTMTDFANSIGAFWTDIIAGRGLGVTLVSMSEFGRNARENASLGTDHGRGTTFFALGKGINGGRVVTKGAWPGLAKANLESGQDLKVTVDFRDLLAEVVQNRLANGANLGYVFPGWTPNFLGVTRGAA